MPAGERPVTYEVRDAQRKTIGEVIERAPGKFQAWRVRGDRKTLRRQFSSLSAAARAA